MSIKVGIDFGTSNSGVAVYDGQRVRLLTASPRNSPERMRSPMVPAVAAIKSVSPVSRPVMEGASPRYGTCWNLTLAILPSNSTVMCKVEPTPADP